MTYHEWMKGELPKDWRREDALVLGITTTPDQTISMPRGWVKTFEEVEGDERFERWEFVWDSDEPTAPTETGSLDDDPTLFYGSGE